MITEIAVFVGAMLGAVAGDLLSEYGLRRYFERKKNKGAN